MNSLQQNQKNLKKKIRLLNIKANFNDTKVSSVATFSYVELFKQIIGLSTILEKGVAYKKAANSTFSTAEIIEYLIDANILGFSRFMHIETLRNDEGYKKFKGIDKLPSEKVCRDLLKALPTEALEELRTINKKYLI